MCGTPGIKLAGFRRLSIETSHSPTLRSSAQGYTGFAACALVYSLLTYLQPNT